MVACEAESEAGGCVRFRGPLSSFVSFGFLLRCFLFRLSADLVAEVVVCWPSSSLFTGVGVHLSLTFAVHLSLVIYFYTGPSNGFLLLFAFNVFCGPLEVITHSNVFYSVCFQPFIQSCVAHNKTVP